ncbi:MAG: P-loop ATPase [Candidatus Aenigmatarchaeota archaeon]|nr:MAG: P-loop ATPase [Candidatus Aenigmarchaeota archaeon]
MKLAILSGKGGTGKSSIAASIAVMFSKKEKIIAVDCDVDAPNLGLILGGRFKWKRIKTNEKAFLIKEMCVRCGRCYEVCNFGAIKWSVGKKPVFDKMLCDGCGACQLVCDVNAIELRHVFNARIGVGKSRYGFHIVSGQLEMGESGSGKIVSVVKEEAYKIAEREGIENIIIDSSAGIGCPVIASVKDADVGIVVTEPTPSAFEGLKRSSEVLQHFGIPYGIVINKYDINAKVLKGIEMFAKEQDIPVIGKIPYDEDFVKALVELKPIVTYKDSFKQVFEDILDKLSNFNV